MKDIEYIKNSLRSACLHINSELNDEKTTKSPEFIYKMKLALTKTKEAISALNEIS